MNLFLIGRGRMGSLVEQIALDRGHGIAESLEGADVAIEFAAAELTPRTVREVASAGKPLVIGTTGWEGDEVLDPAREAGTGVLHSPNYSIGIYYFRMLIREAQRLSLIGYASAGLEWHHSRKQDVPSGTAKLIQEETGIPFQSIRVGEVPGTHQVVFDSTCDTIELTHRARNREGFARGAVEGAEWLIGKRGVYTMDDWMKERVSCTV